MEYLTCGIFNAQRLEIERSWKNNDVGLEYHVNEWYVHSLQIGEHFVNLFIFFFFVCWSNI